MDEAEAIEEQQWLELQQARQMEIEMEEEEALQKAKKKAAKKKLSFLQKVSEHWLILTTAALFDLIGLIPGLCIVTNFVFGLILWLCFAIKRTGEDTSSNLLSIGLPILGGSVIDFFIGIMPTCITATLTKIFFTKEHVHNN